MIIQRQQQAQTLKLVIETGNVVLRSLRSLEMDTTETEQSIKTLKNTLNGIDIYQQKPIYRCATCNEFDCACDVLNSVDPEIKKFDDRLNKLF